MDNPINIRLAVFNDVDSLRELAVSSFVNAYGQYNTKEDLEKYLSENFSTEKITEEIFDSNILILLATRDKQIVAYAKLIFETEINVEAQKPLEIARLYTSVELIGSGIGKMLIREISNYALDNTFDALCLGVWQDNKNAIRFYEREGFVITGNTTFVFGTDVQNDYVMMKKLNSISII